MPRLPMNYQNTIIYKIVCNDLSVTDVYVGHTTNFVKRKNQHKKRCTNENENGFNYKVYQTIRENGGWDNWTMVEIEKYPCNDANEATKRERHYYEILNAKLNTQYPARTQQEYYNQNKEHFQEYKKEYYEDNKDKIIEYRKEYYEDNKDKILEYHKEYSKKNNEKLKQQNKQYREINKEKIKQSKKAYREINKEKIKQSKKEYREKQKQKV